MSCDPTAAPLQFLDVTLSSPAENLALDETLLLEADEGRGRELLRVWDWSTPVVVLGAGCSLTQDVDEAACLRDNVPVLRRSSGGGTVLLGRGCLLYSLVLAFDRARDLSDISRSYRFILERMATCLKGVETSAKQEGISDLAVHGLKFSGNAQQRKRTHLLHHGTLLYDFDLGQVATYLRQPTRQPDYRHDREHAAFLMNLRVGRDELVDRLRTGWQATEKAGDLPLERVRELTATKYLRDEWVRRR